MATSRNIWQPDKVLYIYIYITELYGDFWKKMNKETKLRIHNIKAKAALKFGSEVWVLRKREEQRLAAAQMQFLRHLLGITKLDKEKNRLPKQALQYKPKGRRNVGRPKKRWRDQLHLEDQGTGNTPKPS